MNSIFHVGVNLGYHFQLWPLSDYICGKRLAEYIKQTIPALERFNEIKLDETTREKLLRISPATIDRLLKKEKDKYRLKHGGRSLTKPGTLYSSDTDKDICRLGREETRIC